MQKPSSVYVISVVAMYDFNSTKPCAHTEAQVLYYRLLSREGFRDDLKGTQVGLSEFEARLPPDSMNLSVVTSTTEVC